MCLHNNRKTRTHTVLKHHSKNYTLKLIVKNKQSEIHKKTSNLPIMSNILILHETFFNHTR